MAGALARAYPTGSEAGTWAAALAALCEHLLDREWPDEQGRAIKIGLALIDAGYGESTDTVFDFCRTSPWADRLLPSRGVGIGARKRPIADWPKQPGDKPGPGWRHRWNKARKQREILFDANHWKTFAAARLRAAPGGPGCLLLCGDRASAHEMLAEHLCAEYPQAVTAGERTVDEWIWRTGQDNDLLDVVVGCLVAGSVRGVPLVAAERSAAPAPAPAALSFAELQRQVRDRRRLG
jgi:phage terminase large subunit GpA-like protein